MAWIEAISNKPMLENIYKEGLVLDGLELYGVEINSDTDSVYLKFRTDQKPVSAPEKWIKNYNSVSMTLRCQIIKSLSILQSGDKASSQIHIEKNGGDTSISIRSPSLSISIRFLDLSIADLHPF